MWAVLTQKQQQLYGEDGPLPFVLPTVLCSKNTQTLANRAYKLVLDLDVFAHQEYLRACI